MMDCTGTHRSNNISTIVDKVFFQSDLVEENHVIAGWVSIIKHERERERERDVVNKHDFLNFAGIQHRYILGRYTKLNAPKYLQEDNFNSLLKALKERRLALVHGSMSVAIAEVAWDFADWCLSFIYLHDANDRLWHVCDAWTTRRRGCFQLHHCWISLIAWRPETPILCWRSYFQKWYDLINVVVVCYYYSSHVHTSFHITLHHTTLY